VTGYIEARCAGSTGADLGGSTSRFFHTDRTDFHVHVGTIYYGLGMGIWETVVMILVRDDTGGPSWLPVGLFDINASSLPEDWEFVVLDGIAASGGDASNRWVAMWGYPELVRNRAHSDGLIDRDPQALAVFDREERERAG
jgi:hypothetical protein